MSRVAALWTAAVIGLAGCASLALDGPLALPPAARAPAPPLEMAWRRDVDGGFGADPALALADVLLVSTRRGDLVALAPTTGAVAGRIGLGESLNAAPTPAGDARTLVVPVAGGAAGIRAYDARGGTERWRWPGREASREVRRAAPVTAAPLVAGETVVAATLAGAVVGLDVATGAERWRHRTADTTAQLRAAPVGLGAAILAVADTRGGIVALDAATGRVRWRADAGAPVYETPAAEADRLVVATTRGTVVALDAATGRVAWRAALDPSVRLAAPALAGGLVVAGGSDGDVRAWDAATGALRWSWAGDGAVTTRALVADGRVYVGTQRRRLVVLDAASGAERWATLLDGRVRGAPVAAGGRLYVFAEPRHVYAFRPTVPGP